MTGNLLATHGLVQVALYFAVLLACVKPLGSYMADVYMGKRVWLSPVLAPVERVFYWLAGIDPERETGWKEYAAHLLLFCFGGFLLLYSLLLMQGALPLNPQHFPGLAPDLAFNAAASFVTNTNWQSYGGEMMLSHFSQTVGLAVQNFLSAAGGMAVLAALVRGMARRQSATIGNFWADLLRGCLYVLLPLSLLYAALLGSQGVVQTFGDDVKAPLLESSEEHKEQMIAVGPAATQVAIKQVGTNGGGFFNANSAHPFENPTPLSNFLEMLAILLIPASLCYTFGKMVGDTRQGWAILAAMTLMFLPMFLICLHYEQSGNPRLEPLGITQAAEGGQAGGNMEGKETRFGIVNSALWATATTAASNGSVNAMHDSFTPIGGLMPLLLIEFGEVIFGGAGSGLYSMLMFVIITIFVAGLMVGRTPEYLGKKIQAFEMKMASITILVGPLAVLVGTAAAVMTEAGRAGMLNSGAHGFSEILYAFSSAGNNNGSAFAGINANTPFYNIALGLCMLFGRFWIMVPVLAAAGSLAAKNTVPPSAGTLPTHTPLFIAMLAAVIIMAGVLTFVPALALGPMAEHFNVLKQEL